MFPNPRFLVRWSFQNPDILRESGIPLLLGNHWRRNGPGSRNCKAIIIYSSTELCYISSRDFKAVTFVFPFFLSPSSYLHQSNVAMYSNRISYLFSSKLQAAVFVLFSALQIAFVVSAPQSSVSSTSATPSAPAPSSKPSSSSNVTQKVIANGWYASWYGTELPPSQIPWSKYNSLTFAFA